MRTPPFRYVLNRHYGRWVVLGTLPDGTERAVRSYDTEREAAARVAEEIGFLKQLVGKKNQLSGDLARLQRLQTGLDRTAVAIEQSKGAVQQSRRLLTRDRS